jgi:predicted negative regulator of RcsB-dependent stress response
VDIYSPDDQLATLKEWWKQYGKSLIAGVVLGVLVLGGVSTWRHWRHQSAEAASLQYENLLTEMRQGKNDSAAASADRLMKDYSGTPYAGKAALLLARLRFDANDLPGTRSALEWAMKNASEDAVQHTARLRLGRIALEDKDADTALKLADVRDRAGFESQYEELRGDALLVKGDAHGARGAYQAALEKLPPGSGYARVLALKRDNLPAEPAK